MTKIERTSDNGGVTGGGLGVGGRVDRGWSGPGGGEGAVTGHGGPTAAAPVGGPIGGMVAGVAAINPRRAAGISRLLAGRVAPRSMGHLSPAAGKNQLMTDIAAAPSDGVHPVFGGKAPGGTDGPTSGTNGLNSGTIGPIRETKGGPGGTPRPADEKPAAGGARATVNSRCDACGQAGQEINLVLSGHRSNQLLCDACVVKHASPCSAVRLDSIGRDEPAAPRAWDPIETTEEDDDEVLDVVPGSERDIPAAPDLAAPDPDEPCVDGPGVDGGVPLVAFGPGSTDRTDPVPDQNLARHLATLDAMEARGGGFVRSLAAAWRRADSWNHAKLYRAFRTYYREYGKGVGPREDRRGLTA